MDRDRFEELARDSRFIPGIYNYCDQWCERCPLTWRCLNYAMSEEAERSDAANKLFWHKLDEVFETTAEMIDEQIDQMNFEIDEQELEEYTRQDEEIREAVRAQPFSRLALKYTDVVDQWFKLHEELVGDKDTGRESPTQADIPGAAWAMKQPPFETVSKSYAGISPRSGSSSVERPAAPSAPTSTARKYSRKTPTAQPR